MNICKMFEVLIDESLATINTNATLIPTNNKTALILINDFEDRKWRYYAKFQSFILDNIIETALSKREKKTFVNQGHSRLVAATKNLRLTDKDDGKGKGSELAENVLYGIMKHYYGALSAVPKYFTNKMCKTMPKV